MQPSFYWPARPWWIPALQIGLTVLSVLQVWAGIVTDDGMSLPIWYFIWLALTASWQGAADLHAAHAGVLVVPNGWSGFHYIPLTGAEVKERPRDWYIRWPEGRIWRNVRLHRSPETDAFVRGALEAKPQSGPPTGKDARTVLAMASPENPAEWQTGAALLVLLGVVFLAIWLNLPWLLLVWLGIPWLLARAARNVSRVLLTPEGLWLVRRDCAPVFIDRETARAVALQDKLGNFVRIPLANGEALSLNRYRNTDLLRLLRQPPVAIRHAETAAAPAEPPSPGTTRCSLCGTPVDALPGTVAICDRCGNRARLQAIDTGHGPTGQERKPM